MRDLTTKRAANLSPELMEILAGFAGQSGRLRAAIRLPARVPVRVQKLVPGLRVPAGFVPPASAVNIPRGAQPAKAKLSKLVALANQPQGTASYAVEAPVDRLLRMLGIGTKKLSSNYVVGFLTKCAQEAVDPAALVKQYLATAGDPAAGQRQFEEAIGSKGADLGIMDIGTRKLEDLKKAKYEALLNYAKANPAAGRNINAWVQGAKGKNPYSNFRNPVYKAGWNRLSTSLTPLMTAAAKRNPELFAEPKPVAAAPTPAATPVLATAEPTTK